MRSRRRHRIDRPVLQIVFRFDASPVIGGGHAIRCVALAAELSRLGHRCGFTANEDGVKLAAAILPDADFMRPSDESDEAGDMQKRWPGGVDWLVVDHYGRSVSFEQLFKGWSRKVMAVDDRPTRSHACDILLDQTLDRSEIEYRALVNSDCKVLTGVGFTLIREEFRKHRMLALARRGAIPQLPQIVVSFGASDAGKASLRALEALQLVKLPIRIKILVGRLCPHLDEIEEAVIRNQRTTLVVDPASIARHFAEADLAIGAPGTTAWEWACLGLPAIVIPVADNQSDNAAALARRGLVIALPAIANVTREEIAFAVSSLFDRPAHWRSMSQTASRLVDGNGVKRVVDAMVGA